MGQSKEELFKQLTEKWNEFNTFHNTTTNKGAKDARKSINELKKLVGAYRKVSVEAQKSAKASKKAITA